MIYKYLFLILFLPLILMANEDVVAEQTVWERASIKYGVDEWKLYGIAKVESDMNQYSINYDNVSPYMGEQVKKHFSSYGIKTYVFGDNKQHIEIGCKNKACATSAIDFAEKNNLKYDVGIMQISSVHFKHLAQYNITPYSLLDIEQNIMTGAWEYRGCIDRFGDNWKAVNCYNGLDYNNRVHNKYAWKVYNAIHKNQNNRSRGVVVASDKTVKQNSENPVMNSESRDICRERVQNNEKLEQSSKEQKVILYLVLNTERG